MNIEGLANNLPKKTRNVNSSWRDMKKRSHFPHLRSETQTADMSKLSESVKLLINAAHARPGTTPAPPQISSLYERISRDASSKQVGLPAWLTISTAATITMNSPDSLLELHHVATSSGSLRQKVYAAELMREVGLKCISFNGIPRTINCLGAFYSGLPPNISSALSTVPTRKLTTSTLPSVLKRGLSLWDSVYHPFSEKLTDKLAQSHPDLPVHIHEAHYATVLSDPSPSSSPEYPARTGRMLTSLIAIACLRAQTGVGPQVLSHVFGLRKAFDDGTAEDVEGGRWLASDEGSKWILETVDRIVGEIGGVRGTTFAPGLTAKL